MVIAYAVAGTVIVLVILFEIFEALVLPRRVTRRLRLNRLYYRAAWRWWSAAAGRLRPGPRRQAVLSIFGPLSLLALFALWAAVLIVGFGLIHHAAASRPGGLFESVYFSGVTFTTLGYGDVTPTGAASRVAAVLEASMGFGFFAVVISYLPVLYAAFSRREALIALFDARAGSPPAAGLMLQRFPPGRPGGGAVVATFLQETERWAAEVLEAQLSYPVLGYYRSQHDNQSWLATLVCTLDATALLLTVADPGDRDQARLTFAMARHTIVDLALVLGKPPRAPAEDRLPAARLAELVVAVRAAGGTARDDPAAAAKLTELRGLYEPYATTLAEYLLIPLPAIWPTEDRPDNWQTSAGMRRARPLAALGADLRDDHFR